MKNFSYDTCVNTMYMRGLK